MELNHVTREIIGAAIKVHAALGPGLLESAYRACLKHEMLLRGLQVETEVGQPIAYNGLSLDVGYRLDLVVENIVIVELKVVEKLLPVHQSQLLSYLRLSRRPVGLLINFNVWRLTDGIKRVANSFNTA